MHTCYDCYQGNENVSRVWLAHDFSFAMCSLSITNGVKKVACEKIVLLPLRLDECRFFLVWFCFALIWFDLFVCCFFVFLFFDFQFSILKLPFDLVVIGIFTFSLYFFRPLTLFLSLSAELLYPSNWTHTVSINHDLITAKPTTIKQNQNKTTIKSIDLIIYFRCCELSVNSLIYPFYK